MSRLFTFTSAADHIMTVLVIILLIMFGVVMFIHP